MKMFGMVTIIILMMMITVKDMMVLTVMKTLML